MDVYMERSRDRDLIMDEDAWRRLADICSGDAKNW